MDPGSAPKKTGTFKNCIHVILIILMFCSAAHAVLVDAGLPSYEGDAAAFLLGILKALGLSQLFSFIGAVAFVLFGVVGIYEFAYVNGISPLVPPFYLRFKERKEEEMAVRMMELYYKNHIAFIREYENERIGFVLQSLGLDEKQFHHISYELVKTRVMREKTESDLAQKLETMIYQEDCIVDLSPEPRCDRVYRAVDYYIDLYTALYDPRLCGDVGRIMASYILICLDKDNIDIRDIDYLIIPKGGNLLLGLEVGKILKKRVVAILEEPRILMRKSWDGNYECQPGRANNILILNDVLVSGNRIYQSVEKLPPKSWTVQGLFCLVKYVHENYHAVEVLQQHGIDHIHCLLETSEEKLRGPAARGPGA